jgi:hypothetical protein
MRTIALPNRRVASALLALATALALWLVIAAPRAEAATLKLKGVSTTVTTDPATTLALFSGGIIPLPIAPSSVAPTTNAARYAFPITGGMVDSKTLVGEIRHSGGLVLAHYNSDNTWTALSLARFTVKINGSPSISAVVNGGKRADIATLDLSGIHVKKYMKGGHTFVRISNVGVTLNKTATDAVDATFGTSLPDTLPLGTATVLARVAH